MDGLRRNALALEFALARRIGRERVRRFGAPQVAGLRELFGSRDQLRDIVCIGTSPRLLRRLIDSLRDGHDRDARGLHVLEDAVFYFLLVNAGHCKPSHSGTPGPYYGLTPQAPYHFREHPFLP